jgi:hypothetical protein
LCAAQAANEHLVRHPEAEAEIETYFGVEAYPYRITMADLPQGSAIIPNFYNRVPGFSFKQHHFVPNTVRLNTNPSFCHSHESGNPERKNSAKRSKLRCCHATRGVI